MTFVSIAHISLTTLLAQDDTHTHTHLNSRNNMNQLKQQKIITINKYLSVLKVNSIV